MKIADVEATGSGGSRAEDSEARAQVAGHGARAGTASLAKKIQISRNAVCAERQSLTVSSCLPLQHNCSFMLNYIDQVYDPAERFPADFRSV